MTEKTPVQEAIEALEAAQRYMSVADPNVATAHKITAALTALRTLQSGKGEPVNSDKVDAELEAENQRLKKRLEAGLIVAKQYEECRHDFCELMSKHTDLQAKLDKRTKALHEICRIKVSGGALSAIKIASQALTDKEESDV